jgi:hypothetical protein
MSLAASSLLYSFSQAFFASRSLEIVDVSMRDDLSLPVAVHITSVVEDEMQARVRSSPIGATVILCLMGNYGLRSAFTRKLKAYADIGYSVIAMPYRGVEGIAGPVSEAQLKAGFDRICSVMGRRVPDWGTAGLGDNISVSVLLAQRDTSWLF